MRFMPMVDGEQAGRTARHTSSGTSPAGMRMCRQHSTSTPLTIEWMVRVAGLVLSIAYAVLIVWLYESQPQTRAEALGGLAATVGAYRVDQQAFDDGLKFFRADKFPEARMAFERADAAHRDARTQFYIAYSFYRQGWGRTYNDDALFKQGLEAV